MRILAFSDVHGNIEAINKMRLEIQNEKFDAIIFAGDFTNAIFDGKESGQEQLDNIVKELEMINKPFYFIYGNRDVNVKCNYGYNLHEKNWKLGEYTLTNEITSLSKKKILITHSDQFLSEEVNSFLYLYGHDHTGRIINNKIDLGFLYRDESHKAQPLFGCYWFITIENGKFKPEIHMWQMNEVKCIENIKHGVFYIPDIWTKTCPKCSYEEEFSLMLNNIRIIRKDKKPIIYGRIIKEQLKKLGEKQWSIFGTEEFRDFTFKTEIKNPAPKFVTTKLWNSFEFFVELMIKKFLRDGLLYRQPIIMKDNIIVREGLNLLFNSDQENPSFFGSTENEILKAISLYKNGKEWLGDYIYKDWEDCIQQTWLLTDIMKFYKSQKYDNLEPLKENEIIEMKIFLNNILYWLIPTLRGKYDHINKMIGIDIIRSSNRDFFAINDFVEIGTIYNIITNEKVDQLPSELINEILCQCALPKESYDYYDDISTLGISTGYCSYCYLFPLQLTTWDFKLNDNKKSRALLKQIANSLSKMNFDNNILNLEKND